MAISVTYYEHGDKMTLITDANFCHLISAFVLHGSQGEVVFAFIDTKCICKKLHVYQRL